VVFDNQQRHRGSFGGPAIANGVFTAPGERIRTMPMTKPGFSFA
jgi:hypothetical protein